MSAEPGFLWTDDDAPAAAAPRPVRFARDDVPGEPGIWVFILGDMTVFGVFFTVLMSEFRKDRNLFAESSALLHPAIGMTNTVVLLVSSYLVVLAVHWHRQGQLERSGRALNGALGCSLLFATLKTLEYTLEIQAGHTPASNTFLMLYFVFTGVHLTHVTIGATLLSFWRRKVRRRAPWDDSRIFAESAATFWHMVDLLWIVLFALFYLVSAA